MSKSDIERLAEQFGPDFLRDAYHLSLAAIVAQYDAQVLRDALSRAERLEDERRAFREAQESERWRLAACEAHDLDPASLHRLSHPYHELWAVRTKAGLPYVLDVQQRRVYPATHGHEIGPGVELEGRVYGGRKWRPVAECWGETNWRVKEVADGE